MSFCHCLNEAILLRLRPSAFNSFCFLFFHCNAVCIAFLPFASSVAVLKQRAPQTAWSSASDALALDELCERQQTFPTYSQK